MRNLLLKPLRTVITVSLALVIPIALFAAQKAAERKGSAAKGQAVFEKNCAMCHFSDQVKTKVGPGLKGLFKNKQLPKSHKPATEANIRAQIEKGAGAMPGFGNKLSKVEINDLIAYLKTL
jgi:mono/diheme cytochrome c family protein